MNVLNGNKCSKIVSDSYKLYHKSATTNYDVQWNTNKCQRVRQQHTENNIQFKVM